MGSPSGLPSGRIVRQVYGSRELDLDRQLGRQYDGTKNVRRTLFTATVFTGLLVAAVAIFGNFDTAMGIAMIWLAPLACFLLITHVIVITRPVKPPPR